MSLSNQPRRLVATGRYHLLKLQSYIFTNSNLSQLSPSALSTPKSALPAAFPFRHVMPPCSTVSFAGIRRKRSFPQSSTHPPRNTSGQNQKYLRKRRCRKKASLLPAPSSTMKTNLLRKQLKRLRIPPPPPPALLRIATLESWPPSWTLYLYRA